VPAMDQLSVAFAALAHPARRSILSRLREGPVSVGELAGHYTMTRPAVSQHLAVLERAGLVARDRRSRWRDCRLEADGLDAAAAWIEQQRTDWSERLDALEEHLKSSRTGGDPPRETSAAASIEEIRNEEEGAAP
jgi:DNA-binding transcriptional ArsR family regulator